MLTEELRTPQNVEEVRQWRPPSPREPRETRAEFAEVYVAWFLARSPNAEAALPTDVRDSHRWEVEFSSCLLDPVQYVADTTYELSLLERRAHQHPQL
jgi:hypothetical protein